MLPGSIKATIAPGLAADVGRYVNENKSMNTLLYFCSSLLMLVFVCDSSPTAYVYADDDTEIVIRGNEKAAPVYLVSPIEVDIPIPFNDNGQFEIKDLSTYNIDTVTVESILFELEIKEKSAVLIITFSISADSGCDKLLAISYKFDGDGIFMPLWNYTNPRAKRCIDNGFIINADEGESNSVKKFYSIKRIDFDKYQNALDGKMLLTISVEPNC